MECLPAMHRVQLSGLKDEALFRKRGSKTSGRSDLC